MVPNYNHGTAPWEISALQIHMRTLTVQDKVTLTLRSAPQSLSILAVNVQVWDRETVAAPGASLQAEFRGKLPPLTSLHPSFLQLIEIMTQLPGPGLLPA